MDIQALQPLGVLTELDTALYRDSVDRLKSAVNLRPVGAAGDIFAQVQLPEDANPDLAQDMRELEGAVAAGLSKAALLLAGSLTEALLLSRHPDHSDRGPGLAKLVDQARSERLFGRDTLRSLDTLTEYRDLIHPRAEARNQTPPNEARVEAALAALKLLCSELLDPDAKYANKGSAI